jgi:hypothetical protein
MGGALSPSHGPGWGFFNGLYFRLTVGPCAEYSSSPFTNAVLQAAWGTHVRLRFVEYAPDATLGLSLRGTVTSSN